MLPATTIAWSANAPKGYRPNDTVGVFFGVRRTNVYHAGVTI